MPRKMNFFLGVALLGLLVFSFNNSRTNELSKKNSREVGLYPSSSSRSSAHGKAVDSFQDRKSQVNMKSKKGHQDHDDEDDKEEDEEDGEDGGDVKVKTSEVDKHIEGKIFPKPDLKTNHQDVFGNRGKHDQHDQDDNPAELDLSTMSTEEITQTIISNSEYPEEINHFLPFAYRPPVTMHTDFYRNENLDMSLDLDSIDKWKLWDRLIDGVLVVGAANYAHLPMILNLAKSIEKAGYGNDKFFLICLDKEICAALEKHKVPCGMLPLSWLNKDLMANAQREEFAKEGVWGNANYNWIIHVKSAVVLQLIQHGFTTLFCDSDIVFVKPGVMEYLNARFEEDPRRLMLASLETQKDKFLYPYVNSGFYMIKPHPLMIRFFELVTLNQMKRPEVVDQFVFNEAMDLLGMKVNGARRHVVHFLDRLLFTNGYYYFRHEYQKKQGVVPYMIHANYIGGKNGKELAFRSAGLWFVEATGLSNNTKTDLKISSEPDGHHHH